MAGEVRPGTGQTGARVAVMTKETGSAWGGMPKGERVLRMTPLSPQRWVRLVLGDENVVEPNRSVRATKGDVPRGVQVTGDGADCGDSVDI